MITAQLKAAGAGIAGVALIAIIAWVGVLQLRMGAAQQRAETAEAALELCKRERGDLEAAIAKQNTAVAALQAASKAQAERVATAAQEAAQARRDAEARVRRIMAQPVPQECAAAVRWGAEQAAVLAEGWL